MKPHGSTLIELLVVSGLMILVLTVMAVSLTTSRRAQEGSSRANDLEQDLRQAHHSLARHLSRCKILSPSIGLAASEVEIAPYLIESDDTLRLQPGGVPTLTAPATIVLNGERLLLRSSGGEDKLLGRLGSQADFQAARQDLHLLRVDLRAGGDPNLSRVMTVQYYVP